MKRLIIRKFTLIFLLLLLALSGLNVTPLSAATEDLAASSHSDFENRGGMIGRLLQICSSSRTPCLLTAVASSRSGTVNLSWRSNGSSLKGYYLVERSTNNRTWRNVTACKTKLTTSVISTRYSCSDIGLRSRTVYYYRACYSTSELSCGTSYATSVTSVRTQ